MDEVEFVSRLYFLQHKVDIAIVGNGILGCAIAEALLESGLKIALLGPSDRPEAASVSAAAMLNSFAELNVGALDHELQTYKFSKSKEASRVWPSYLEHLEKKSGLSIPHIEGTSLVKTTGACHHHYNTVKQALIDYEQDFEEKESSLFIKNEGAVQPSLIFAAFEQIFSNSENLTQMDGFAYKLEIDSMEKRVIAHNGDVIQAKHIILASGVHVSELCQKTKGLEKVLQLFNGRGLSAHLHLPDHGLEHTHRTCHDGAHCGVYLIPYDEDHLFLGATSELMDKPKERNKRIELNHLFDKASEYLISSIRDAQMEKVLLGYRPTTADAMPIIGESSQKGVWIVSGTKRDGFHLAPIIAKEVTQAILNEGVAFDQQFNPERELIFMIEEEKMFEIAEPYFQLSREALEKRWQLIKQNYPNIKGLHPEMWVLYENQWVS